MERKLHTSVYIISKVFALNVAIKFIKSGTTIFLVQAKQSLYDTCFVLF